MKYIKTYENSEKNTMLKKLYDFLKKKGLKVKYEKEGTIKKYTWGEHESEGVIWGQDFFIYFNESNVFKVNYIKYLTFNKKGERCGGWDRKYFDTSEFEEIFQFVRFIKIENDSKKYNL